MAPLGEQIVLPTTSMHVQDFIRGVGGAFAPPGELLPPLDFEKYVILLIQFCSPFPFWWRL